MHIIKTEKQYHITQRALAEFYKTAHQERYAPLTLVNVLLYEATWSEIEVLEAQVEQFTQASHGH